MAKDSLTIHRRSQGAFEYILMLSGVLLIVITIIFVLQGSLSGTNNTISSQQDAYNRTVSIDVVRHISPNLPVVRPTGDLPATEALPCCVSNGATEQCTRITDYTAVLLHADQSAGTQVVDSTLAGRNGSCGTGNVASPTSANCVWAAGKSGNSLNTGTNVFVRINNLEVDPAAGAINTVEFWVYTYGMGGMPFGWNNAYDLYTSGNCFGFNTGNSDIVGVNVNALPRGTIVGRWAHVVAGFYNGVPSNANSYLYIDGVRQALGYCTGSSSSSKSATSSAFISGWGADSGYKFNGLIDEFAIYNHALTAQQVADHYAWGVARFYNSCNATRLTCPSGWFVQSSGVCA